MFWYFVLDLSAAATMGLVRRCRAASTGVITPPARVKGTRKPAAARYRRTERRPLQ